jgi:hypothetical protein
MLGVMAALQAYAAWWHGQTEESGNLGTNVFVGNAIPELFVILEHCM